MARSFLIALAALVGSGCAATLHPVDRAQWTLVTTDDGKGQELIPQDNYEKEVVAGRERKVKLAVDEKPPMLHEAVSPLTAKVGQVLRFRVNEGGRTDVMSDDAVAEVFWTETYKVDGWKGDQATEGRESTVYVHCKKAGKGHLRLSDDTWGVHEFELVVK